MNIAEIVAKASSLTERLQSGFIPKLNESQQIEPRLNAWVKTTAKGDRQSFEKRLAWDGLTVETVSQMLGDVEWDTNLPLPTWTNTLQQIVDTAENITLEELFNSQAYLNPDEPLPFEHFYLPCVQVASRKLWSELNIDYSLFHDSVKASLERSLVKRLLPICSWTLLKEFSLYRSSGNDLKDFLLVNIRGRSSQVKYRGFVQKLFTDGLVSFFEKYSVLARLIATAIDFWVEANAEFFLRLQQDWSKIEQMFSEGAPLKQLVEIKPSLSDSHNRGRSVMALKFANGVSLVYKPKSLDLEVAFNEILQWCNSQNLPLNFYTPKILNGDRYGWMEYISAVTCETVEVAKSFYQRLGMLLSLVYVLEGTDCHYENLIAYGEYPVLIDVETLLHPRPKTVNPPSDTDLDITESVLRTHLLPNFYSESIKVDDSGIGGVQEQQLSLLSFQNINTDAMNIDYESVTLKQANSPTLNDTPIFPSDYLEEIIMGFTQMYGLLMQHQTQLLSSDSPLMSLANREVRFLFRSTANYSILLQNSYLPNFLETGIDRSIYLDLLSRAFLVTEEKPLFWPILAAEVQYLEQMDIPLFLSNSSSEDLTISGDVIIEKLFLQSSFNKVLARITNLNDLDLQQQISIIKMALQR